MKVFVYGTLKSGYGNNYLVADGQFLGKAVTLRPYILWHSGFPIATHNDEIANRLGLKMLPIIGEVYEVNDSQLARTDSLEGHPRWYVRQPVDVVLEDGTQLTPHIYEQNTYEGRGVCRIVDNSYYLWER